MRALYVAHTGRIGGGERSLLDLLDALPPEIEPSLACAAGPLAERVAARGIPVLALPEIEGMGRGPASVSLAIGRMAVALRRHADAIAADVIHAVSIRSGLAAVLAARLGAPCPVVDIRDCLRPGGADGLAQRWLARGPGVLLANSRYTAQSFADATGVMPRVVHPLVDLDPFRDPGAARGDVRTRLRVPEHAPLLAVVGQLTPWKGQDDAIEILARIRGRFPDAVLALAGERKFDAATRHDNKAFELRLHDLCARRGVAGSVRFLGEREDVADLLPAVDVLLVPSWEEPFGRTVLEGMAAGVVVVATDTGGPAEIAHDGSDAVLLPPRQPAAWAEELVSLLSSDEARLALAEGGRRRAEAFARERGERMRTIVDAYRIATMTPPGRRLRGLVHV